MIKTSVDLISGKVMLHKHQDVYDILEGDNSELWTSIDIASTATGTISLGSKLVYQGFIMNYILKVGASVQYGNIHIVHNVATIGEPYHEFYYAGVSPDIVFTAAFNVNDIELDIENNELSSATFKYRILENILVV